MKTKLHYLFIMLALLVGIHQAIAQGTTAFTYQGQLRDGGTNANGNYTMIFALYGASTNSSFFPNDPDPTQIGGSISNTVNLANGLFTVNLDFGARAFNGSASWLEITVQHGRNAQNTGPLISETLSPRVQVLPTPYALYAAVAAGVTNGAISSNSIASGQVVKSINGVMDNLILSAGGDATLTTNVTTNGIVFQFVSSPPNMKVFYTNDSFVVPKGVTNVTVEMWGGGGGGGKADMQGYVGGGGGGGGYVKGALSVTSGTNYAIIVGSGGPSSGGGGDSSFGSLISAAGGGVGGSGDTGGSGGIGGNGSGGQLTLQGSSGLYGTYGPILPDGSDQLEIDSGGNGGASFGASPGLGVSGDLGGNGNSPGGGGAGGGDFIFYNDNNGTQQNHGYVGGVGGAGLVIIYY